jgi:hypothetical protein
MEDYEITSVRNELRKKDDELNDLRRMREATEYKVCPVSPDQTEGADGSVAGRRGTSAQGRDGFAAAQHRMSIAPILLVPLAL